MFQHGAGDQATAGGIQPARLSAELRAFGGSDVGRMRTISSAAAAPASLTDAQQQRPLRRPSHGVVRPVMASVSWRQSNSPLRRMISLRNEASRPSR